MAILRPFLTPTVGNPQPVKLNPRRRRNMTEEDFYQSRFEDRQTQQQQPIDPASSASGLDLTQLNRPNYINQPVTGDYLQGQLSKLESRPSRPELNPGSRVKSPDQQLVESSNFIPFYEMLGSIEAIGNERLAAEQARSAYKQQQQLLEVLSQQVQPFRGATLSGGSSVGSSGRGYVPSSPRTNFKYAQNIAGRYGWNNPAELGAWYTLGMKESGWNNNAQNPTSTAFGIGQFLDSTWKTVGGVKTSNPAAQVEYMARYIRNRYGSPSRALAFHRANNWY